MVHGYGFPISPLSFPSPCSILSSHYCSLGHGMVGDWGAMEVLGKGRPP